MAIREKIKDGKKSYEVSYNIRSKVNPKLRVQRFRAAVPTLKAAQLIEREMMKECAAEVARKEGSGVPWFELVDRWELAVRNGEVHRKKLSEPTFLDILAALRRFTAEWEDKLCNEILPGDVRRVFTKMEEQDYSVKRLKAVKTAINTVFRWGIEDGFIVGVRQSPAMIVDVTMKKEETVPDILTVSEIQKLLECAKKLDIVWYPVWRLALNTGMRSGELFALEWGDIDFESRHIMVSKSYNKRLYTVKCTKAGYWRKVPMNADCEELLRDLYSKKRVGEKHVLPRIGDWMSGEQARVLREFCEGIGIRPVVFHALRACFATHLLNAGVAAPAVKKICGWSNEKVMNRYIRLAGIDVVGATDALKYSQGYEAKKEVKLSFDDVKLG